MKSILISVVFMSFALMLNAQTQDSTRSLDKAKNHSGKNSTYPIEDVEENVFLVVEVAPEYPGGLDSLMKYLQENITYPKDAREANIQGTVYVTFIVEANGSVSSVKVLRGIGGGCDEEAARVVKGMPNWKPGTQRGKPVRVQFNLPVRFILHGPEPEKTTE